MEQKKKVKLINFGAELQNSVLISIEEGKSSAKILVFINSVLTFSSNSVGNSIADVF